MNTCWNKRWMIVMLVAACATFTVCKVAGADVVTVDPSLPVTYPTGEYLTAADVHATYSGGALLIVLQDIRHRAFAVPPIVRETSGLDELETFSSLALGHVSVSVNGIPQIPPLSPFQAQGPVQTRVFGKVGNTTGTFDTEMLSMSLTGNTPLGLIMIRESPTLPSTGRTSIADIGGGLYQIDSFFDVFTELSIDSGNSWIPSSGSVRVNLESPVPEPGVLTLLGLSMLALVKTRRR